MTQREKDLEFIIKQGRISPVYDDYRGFLSHENYVRLYSLYADLQPKR